MSFKRKVDPGSANAVKFDKVGDSVTGIYLGGTLDEKGKFGPVMKHLFETENGLKIAFSKEASQMSRILAGEEGNRIRLVFEDTKQSGKGNPQKIYAVEVDTDFTRLSKDQLVGGSSTSSGSNGSGDLDIDEDVEYVRTSAPTTAEKKARVAELLRSKRNS